MTVCSRRLFFSSMQRDRYYQPDRAYPICLSRRAVDLVISSPVVTVTRTVSIQQAASKTRLRPLSFRFPCEQLREYPHIPSQLERKSAATYAKGSLTPISGITERISYKRKRSPSVSRVI